MTYQRTTGPLMANSHPGSYCGQDAYSDMLVTKSAERERERMGDDHREEYRDPPRDVSGTEGAGLQRSGGGFYEARRLTPTECARLQGFPDDWAADIPHTDSAEYKMWGNGIALPCLLPMMKAMADILE